MYFMFHPEVIFSYKNDSWKYGCAVNCHIGNCFLKGELLRFLKDFREHVSKTNIFKTDIALFIVSALKGYKHHLEQQKWTWQQSVATIRKKVKLKGHNIDTFVGVSPTERSGSYFCLGKLPLACSMVGLRWWAHKFLKTSITLRKFLTLQTSSD